jgi:hypothetical protein
MNYSGSTGEKNRNRKSCTNPLIGIRMKLLREVYVVIHETFLLFGS